VKIKEIDFKKTPLVDIYGENCFDETTLKERVPKTIYKEFKKVQAGEQALSLDVAEVIASAMKDWATEKGATHFTHWFQPLTGRTAEKHDSFIDPNGTGQVMMRFSGKELIQGEPDASSFPSGGLRATFEARGYTAWDTTSPAFLKDDNTGTTLYIPTAFVSYRGEALDKKVPLLRSMEAVGKQALRVLKTLGNTTSTRVTATLGAEQEYFLVEKEFFENRLDLMQAGRTLFGADTAKGQELNDHYFGTIKERVADFMRELDYELWKLGISSKTKHNEVAPNQFEIAPIFDTVNVGTDRNQVTMDTINKVASRHGLVALLHEKPFAGVNGSGKHNNWSLSTDDGLNLLEPGDNPHDNAQFLVFLTAIIKAVDTYAPQLRLSAGSAGNDHRLGGHEAPPAIISIFLGDQLENILKAISDPSFATEATGGFLEIGADALPKLPKDLTDRNRTSPFAFTGNKFEFRMVGSAASTSSCNIILNTVVADVLSQFADKLEVASDINAAIKEIVVDTYKNHGRVIFNGNGYSKEWVKEAEKRGLPNLKTTADALKYYNAPETVEVFERHGVLGQSELDSRYNIYAEEYVNLINIEANVMLKMATQEIYPAANKYAAELAKTLNEVRASLGETELMETQKAHLVEVLENAKGLKLATQRLRTTLKETKDIEDAGELALAFKEKVLTTMAELRTYGDNLELLVEKAVWPFPTYEDLLFKL
jgi:glutamine synthetase